jgi:hypothetical protein
VGRDVYPLGYVQNMCCCMGYAYILYAEDLCSEITGIMLGPFMLRIVSFSDSLCLEIIMKRETNTNSKNRYSVISDRICHE